MKANQEMTETHIGSLASLMDVNHAKREQPGNDGGSDKNQPIKDEGRNKLQGTWTGRDNKKLGAGHTFVEQIHVVNQTELAKDHF